jgi:hypothetical protein
MSRQLNLAFEGSEITTMTAVTGETVKPRSPNRPRFRAQIWPSLSRSVRPGKIPAKARGFAGRRTRLRSGRVNVGFTNAGSSWNARSPPVTPAWSVRLMIGDIVALQIGAVKG